MMLPVRLWIRRSSALLAFPAMLVIVFLVLFSRSGWSWERSQAVSWATACTILLGPLAAGLVAFDVWRRQTSTMRELAASTRRGTAGIFALALAAWLLAVLAWLSGLGVALAMASSNGAAGPVPWWTIVQGLLVMLACVCIGALIGATFRSVAAAPVAAVVCYLVPIGANIFGLQGFMTAGGATAPLIGITQDRTIAVVLVLAAALAAALAWAMVRRSTAPTDAFVSVGAAVLGVALVGSLVYLNTLSPVLRTMQPSASAEVCVGSSPEVCGPGEGAALYAVAADDLQSAGQLLSKDGVPLRDRYDYPRGDIMIPPGGAGMLSLSPSEVTDDGHLAPWDVALTIATPSVCAAYYGDSPPDDLLDAQGSLATWIVDRLSGEGGDSPADADGAQRAMEALQTCDGGAAGSWTYVSD